jgi:proteasome lid subunit RPN8/RPN11
MINYKQLTTELGKYAQAQYPFEACGIITKDFRFIPSKNLSNKPRSSFMLDPLLFVEHDDNIWGIFHSHPNEKHSAPSEEDLKHLVYDELKFVLGVQDTLFIYWYDKEKNIKRYELLNEDHFKNN